MGKSRSYRARRTNGLETSTVEAGLRQGLSCELFPKPESAGLRKGKEDERNSVHLPPRGREAPDGTHTARCNPEPVAEQREGLRIHSVIEGIAPWLRWEELDPGHCKTVD